MSELPNIFQLKIRLLGICPPEDCGGPDAWQDMGMMTGWLGDVMQTDTANKTVSELLPEDVEAAIKRMVARGPYVRGKFLRKQVRCPYYFDQLAA